jgi:hypothetical protein
MNVALSEWGEEQFMAIATAYLTRRDRDLVKAAESLGFTAKPIELGQRWDQDGR